MADHEDDNDIEILSADHPAMQRVQRALKRQLERRIATLRSELSEKAQSSSDAQRQRETVGVELYNLQQLLAKLQTQLEQTHAETDDVSQQREQAEQVLSDAKSLQRQVRDELAAIKKQADLVRAELEQAASTAQTVERHNEELRTKVQVQRRVVSKAATEQDKLEQEKQKQDLYVDSLNERAKELSTNLAVVKNQKLAQEKETQAAQAALREASAEVDAIAIERRELQQQWADSMAGLAKRDEALAALDAAVREQQQQVFAKERETENLKRLAAAEQDRSEAASQSLSRFEADLTASKQKLESLLARQDEAKRQYALYTRTLQETEAQIARLTTEANIKQVAVKNAREQVERLSRRRVELEGALATTMMDHTTLDKAGKAVVKATKDVRARIAQQDAIAATIENDIARQTMLATDAAALIESAKEQIVLLQQEQGEQNAVVGRYETEARRTASEMQRKQAQVDLLNRRIDAARQKLAAEGGGNADVTPSDIEIAGLQRSITETAEANAQHQQRWLGQQRELVALHKDNQRVQETIGDTKTRLTLLQEKKLRVDGDCEAVRSDTKEVMRSFRALQSDVVRLNTLITEKKGIQQQLLQETAGMETDLLHTLREEELRSIQMQEKLAGVQAEKEQLANAINEAERQLLLWEKKIQLAKETKAQLESDDTKEELEMMRAEVHRMELRLEQVEKCKERLIVEMERSVDRREAITTKAHLNHKAGKNVAQAAVKKDVADLSRKLKQTTGDVAQCENDLTGLRASLNQLNGALQQAQDSAAGARQLERDAQRRIEELSSARVRNTEAIVYEQQTAKRLQQLIDGRARLRYADEASYEQALARATANMRAIGSINDYVSREHVDAQGALQRLQTAITGELARAEHVADAKRYE